MFTFFFAQQDETTAVETTIPTFAGLFDKLDILNRPNELLDMLGQMPFVLAMAIVIIGLLCVFNGYRWHKWVVVILAFMAGLALGRMLSLQFGRSDIVAVAIGVLCAVVATPLLRVAVAIFGGMAGAFVGANAWSAFNAEQADVHWAGAVIGFVALAILSFVLFRLVVVTFTSIGGAAMVVFGVITLLMHVDGWEVGIRSHLETNTMLIPLLVTVAAVSGFVLQETRSRQDAANAEEQHSH